MLTFQWKWQCGKTHRVLQNGMWFIVGFTTPVANEELNHTGELARDNMMCLAYSMQHAYIYIYTHTYIEYIVSVIISILWATHVHTPRGKWRENTCAVLTSKTTTAKSRLHFLDEPPVEKGVDFDEIPNQQRVRHGIMMKFPEVHLWDFKRGPQEPDQTQRWKLVQGTKSTDGLKMDNLSISHQQNSQ